MKDFKLAQIVPRSCLQLIEKNHYHMCLAHLVYEERRGDVVGSEGTGDHRYTDFYRRMSDEGKFVLMDNGVAEGSQLQVDDLLEMYELVNPTEIVVPDTLFDAKDTLAKLDEFLLKHSDLPYRFMAVPQGNNLPEWLECARKMLTYRRVNTIGISKFLNIATGDSTIRYDAAAGVQAIAEFLDRTDVEIHLLGCDEGPATVNWIHNRIPMVRGCDSAFAYIAAQAGVVIGSDTKRPEGTIDFLDGQAPECLRSRLYEMEAAAGAIYNTSDEHWRDDK